jgi:hypothetical protein
MITQVVNAIRIQDLPTQMYALQRGLFELETWANSEWYVIVSLLFVNSSFFALLVLVINLYWDLCVIKHKH